MNWSYDGETDALYVQLREGEPFSQLELADGTVVDLDAAGRLLGIEVLGVAHGWSPDLVSEHFGLSDDEHQALIHVAFFGPVGGVRLEGRGRVVSAGSEQAGKFVPAVA